MRLYEYQGIEIFKKNKIPVPKHVLIGKNRKASIPFDEFVLKAQVLEGKRRKHGLVLFTTKKKYKNDAKKLFAKTDKLLACEKVKVLKELFVSLTIDKVKKKPLFLFSFSGGIEIENIAANHPRLIKKVYVDSITQTIPEIHRKVKIDVKHRRQLDKIIRGMWTIFTKYDAMTVEINPLGFTKDKLIALDSKVIVDSNALFRQDFDIEHEYTRLESKAAKYDMNYVKLEGDVGVIGNGAGLVMATLDILKNKKLDAANFLDIGGGADAKKMLTALNIVASDKRVKSIFINVFGGITRCDEIAKGLLAFINKSRNKKGVNRIPIFARIEGTNIEKAKQMLSGKVKFSNHIEAPLKEIVRWHS